MKPWYFSRPHFPAFHLSWLAFFAAFVSTFAPAALLPVIRDNLDLTKTDLGNAGIAAVCGAIAARVAMGNFVGEYPHTALNKHLLCVKHLCMLSPNQTIDNVQSPSTAILP